MRNTSMIRLTWGQSKKLFGVFTLTRQFKCKTVNQSQLGRLFILER